MPAYLIGRMEITDIDAYNEYKKRTPGLVSRFGGRFLCRGVKKTTVEGPKETRRLVIVEFPTSKDAQDFYYSPEYQHARTLRENAASEMQIVIVEGFEESQTQAP